MIEQHTGIEGGDNVNTFPGGTAGSQRLETIEFRLSDEKLAKLQRGEQVDHEVKHLAHTAVIVISAGDGNPEEQIVSPGLQLLHAATPDRQPLRVSLDAEQRALLPGKKLRLNLQHNIATDRVILVAV